MSLYSPQIAYRLTWDQIQTFILRSQWLTISAVMQMLYFKFHVKQLENLELEAFMLVVRFAHFVSNVRFGEMQFLFFQLSDQLLTLEMRCGILLSFKKDNCCDQRLCDISKK
jgi:hypothetical protein